MKRCLPFILLFISLLAVPAAGQSLQELWIANGQRNIYGEISKPRNTGRKQPVAIISHGFNGTHHYGRTYFETLNAIGYQVYVFDFPCGSVHSRSDNNTLNMSAMDEKSDVKAIVNYFREQPDVDSDGIVLIGESQGGFVTALASAEIPDTTYLWDVPLGRRFFLELRDIEVFKTLKKYKRPVLIVQGDKDPVVRMEDSRRAVKTYKNARLHVIPGAGHRFKPEEQAQSLREIKAFLEGLQNKDVQR